MKRGLKLRKKTTRLTGVLALLLLFCTAGYAQNSDTVRVRGVVQDVNLAPLAGASVINEIRKTGVVTNASGAYSITASRNDVLVFSFLGYGSQEIKVGNKTTIDVTLIPGTDSTMKEVVVIGYGQVKKKDLTGSVVNVNMEDIKDVPVLSVDLALQGRVPGADIMASTGEPGAPASIRIRGTRSISASNEPLIVVDGVMDAVQSLTDIAMDDIASVSVLKDASATAIYGSRGSNGVIIVTTKKGKKGKNTIHLKADMGFSQLPRKLNIMNASEFAQYRNDFAYFSTQDNYGLIDEHTPLSEYYPFADPLSSGKGTDWVDEISRIAPYQNFQLSLSGGSSKSTYYASASFDNTQGIIEESGMKRFTARLNLDHQLLPWMKVGYKFNYTNRNEDQNKVSIGGTNWWSAAIFLNPLIKVYDNFNDLWYSGQVFNSPRSVLDYDVIRNIKRDGSNNTAFVEIEPMKGLKLNSQLNHYKYGAHTFRYDPGNLPAKAENEGGMAYRGELTQTNMMSQTTLTYATTLSNRHKVDVMGGFIGQRNISDNLVLEGRGYQSDPIRWNNMNAIPDKENYNASSSNTERTAMSYMARINYNFDNRYYFTATGRRDGASNFAADRKWALFPSGAFKWNITNEKFMRGVQWLDEFSLRLSAGRTGNDGIASYRSMAALASTTSGAYLFDGTQPVAFYPSRLASDNLSWEKTDMYNAAADIALFKNRVNMTLEAYLSNTSDLLLNVQTPTQTGYSSRLANVGRTSNKGIEFSIETKNIDRKDFSWSSVFSVSHNKQMVEDIGTFDFVNVYNSYNSAGNSYRMYGYVKDYPLNALWGFKFGGVWKSREEIERNVITKAYVSNVANPNNYAVGNSRYLDINHDGLLNSEDLVYLGNADPFIYGGLQNNFRYKNLSLGVFFNYSLGGKIYNISEQWMGNGSTITNQYRYMLNAWHPVRNPKSDIPKAGSYDALASDRMMHDATFLRLKNVSLGYTWDVSRITNKTIDDIRFVLSGENLILWKSYNGFDPDVSSESGTSTLRRLDIGAYPKPRTVIFSIQVRY